MLLSHGAQMNPASPPYCTDSAERGTLIIAPDTTLSTRNDSSIEIDHQGPNDQVSRQHETMGISGTFKGTSPELSIN